MKIFVFKEKSEKFETLFENMNKRKYDKIISNIEKFCTNNNKNDKIVKISKDIYFYRINNRTRLIFSVVEDNIILYDVYYSDIDIDIKFTKKELNGFFPIILTLEFLSFMALNYGFILFLIALTMMTWTYFYTKEEKNGQNIKNNS